MNRVSAPLASTACQASANLPVGRVLLLDLDPDANGCRSNLLPSGSGSVAGSYRRAALPPTLALTPNPLSRGTGEGALPALPGFLPAPTPRGAGPGMRGVHPSIPPHLNPLPTPLPLQSGAVQVRSSRFFHSSEFANVSSSALNSSKMVRDATRIIFRFARLSATVSRRGSSRNSLDASRYARSLSVALTRITVRSPPWNRRPCRPPSAPAARSPGRSR